MKEECFMLTQVEQLIYEETALEYLQTHWK